MKESLFDRAPDADYLRQWQATLATPAAEAALQSESYVLFRLHGQLFGLPSLSTSEVVPPRAIRAVPNRSRKLLLGLVNLHGHLELCVSLAGLLTPDSGATVTPGLFLVADLHGDSYVIPVDEVLSILRFPQKEIAPPPQASRYLSGIVVHQEELVGLIDTQSLQQTLLRGVSR